MPDMWKSRWSEWAKQGRLRDKATGESQSTHQFLSDRLARPGPSVGMRRC